MKIRIAAVGRLRPGAEADLIADYQTRFNRTGRALGLGPLDIREVEAKKGGMAAEAELLAKAASGAAPLIALDERGQTMTSPEFACKLAGWRDDGRAEACFLIGGADGLAPDLRARADLSLSFGKMVWPHMLVRVMLAEQLYRAAAILAGTPYHRD
ncbi:MAG: 23S rRNA (pseudouridine(1915)-N(3))-methyltransferase RlmH [Paracoccaceae bacterium]|nr:23S rRNA (pseudouridine(1915)-N(3))-methyltransferase RlmH [Paracoccaceae bacterium]